MDVGGWIATAAPGLLSGLLSGLLGGLWTASAIARRGEVARKRYEAELAIWRELVTYRDLLRYNHDQLYVDQAFPATYAEIKGQQEFAEKVLIHLPALRPRTRARLYGGLHALVGPTSLGWVEKYLYVPDGMRNAEGDGRQHFVEQYRALKDEEYRGAISALIRTQNKVSEHQELYDSVMSLFGSLLSLVAPDRQGPWGRLIKKARAREYAPLLEDL